MSELAVPKVPKRENNLLFVLVAAILAPLLRLTMRIKTEGTEKLPKGGYVLVGNHLSYLDPLAFAYSVYLHMKRTPHYLAKASLFKVPILGFLLPKVGQIPVFRGGKSNDEPLRAAKEFIRAGQVVVVFPEGTLTRDPELWPMRGKTGAIRMAAELGVPIVPAAHWGVHKILGNYNLKFRPNPFHLVKVKIGDPIYLDIGTNPTTEQVNDATGNVMKTIAALVGELRGEAPPAKLWNPSEHDQDVTGNFRKKR